LAFDDFSVEAGQSLPTIEGTSSFFTYDNNNMMIMNIFFRVLFFERVKMFTML